MINMYRYLTFFCDEMEKEDCSWLVSKYDCALYNLDYSKMEANRICDLPRDGVLREYLYTYIINADEVLGITPQNTFSFCVYDKGSSTKKTYILPVEKKYGGITLLVESLWAMICISFLAIVIWHLFGIDIMKMILKGLRCGKNFPRNLT